jgi:hypothetical protein
MRRRRARPAIEAALGDRARRPGVGCPDVGHELGLAEPGRRVGGQGADRDAVVPDRGRPTVEHTRTASGLL